MEPQNHLRRQPFKKNHPTKLGPFKRKGLYQKPLIFNKLPKNSRRNPESQVTVCDVHGGNLETSRLKKCCKIESQGKEVFSQKALHVLERPNTVDGNQKSGKLTSSGW